jgi:hypothetical protein
MGRTGGASRAALAGLVLLLLAAVLAGCKTGAVESGVRVGWVGNSSPGHISAQYAHFDGTYGQAFEVRSGQAIAVDCSATETGGVLAVEVLDPDGSVIWQRTANTTAVQHGVVAARSDGSYTVQARGRNSDGGAFDVSWTVS